MAARESRKQLSVRGKDLAVRSWGGRACGCWSGIGGAGLGRSTRSARV
jgi:hypothetical protein